MRLDQFPDKKTAIDYIRKNIYGCAQLDQAEKFLREKLPKESYYQRKIIELHK